jgi:hypothetical protein
MIVNIDGSQNVKTFLSFRVILGIILAESVKMLEHTNVLEIFRDKLMVECLNGGPFLSSSNKKCEYIRFIIQISEEFERDLALGVMELLKTAIEATNNHTDPQVNLVSICLFISYCMKYLNLFCLLSLRYGWKFKLV